MPDLSGVRLLAVSVALLLAGCAGRPAAMAIVDVTVIDAIYGQRDHQSVVLDGERIVAVLGPEQRLPPVRETIDGRGRYVIPGLWDFHVHLTYDERLTSAMPGLFLRWGVTSVRDTGGQLSRLEPLVRSLRASDAAAPRVFFAGPLLDGPLVIYEGVEQKPLGVAVPDAATADATVAHLKSRGVDFIKIYELVSPGVFAALVAAARRHQLPIDSHVPLLMLAREAGAQVDAMQHLRNIELDCAGNAPALLAERKKRVRSNPGSLSGFALRGAVRAEQIDAAIRAFDRKRCDETIQALTTTLQVPTLRLNAYGIAPPYGDAAWTDALAVLPESVSREWNEYRQRILADPPQRDLTRARWSLKLTGEMFAAGVPFAAGTDTPIAFSVPGYSLHRELEFLVRAGLTPLQAIASATLEPARFFGLEQSLGAIAPGFDADLLLLGANPLNDIRQTRNLVEVFYRGKRFR
ncbi:MAG: amidohydrolase family protein [Pseudomonadota bacterium]